MKSISREDLKEVIILGVNELEHAFDKHNCGSDMVKVYLNGDSELYHTIQQSNSWNQGDTEILSFEYSRPEYNSTTQEMLDDSDYKGTIAAWDWENFTCSDDFDNYVEELLYKAIDGCMYLDIEIV